MPSVLCFPLFIYLVLPSAYGIIHRKQDLTDYSVDPEVKRFVCRAASLPLVTLDKFENIWIDTCIIVNSLQGDWKVNGVQVYGTTLAILRSGIINQVVKKAHPNIYISWMNIGDNHTGNTALSMRECVHWKNYWVMNSKIVYTDHVADLLKLKLNELIL